MRQYTGYVKLGLKHNIELSPCVVVTKAVKTLTWLYLQLKPGSQAQCLFQLSLPQGFGIVFPSWYVFIFWRWKGVPVLLLDMLTEQSP